MDLKIWRKKKEAFFVNTGYTIYGPALNIVGVNGNVISPIASINSQGQLVLHQSINTEIGLDLTDKGRMVVVTEGG